MVLIVFESATYILTGIESLLFTMRHHFTRRRIQCMRCHTANEPTTSLHVYSPRRAPFHSSPTHATLNGPIRPATTKSTQALIGCSADPATHLPPRTLVKSRSTESSLVLLIHIIGPGSKHSLQF